MNALYLLAIFLFLIPLAAAVFIIINGKSTRLQHPTRSTTGDEMISDTVISTGTTKSFNHTAPDIEPMIGMTNTSTGAVMINSLIDSTGHTYGV